MQPARSVVLLLTHRQDYYTVDLVAAELLSRGARPVRVNTDDFPEALRLSSQTDAGGAVQHIVAAESSVRGEEVCAVWTRKLWSPRIDESLDARYRESCVKESAAALQGILDGLHAARWINPPARTYESLNKMRQLRAARDAGLAVPRTLLSNDPQRVRDFYRELDGRMVTKLLLPLSTSMEAASYFMHTSDVRETDLAHLDSLRHCPMVFQERIEKRCELRVVYVAGRSFVGVIHAADSARGKTDWRLASPEECRWESGELPAVVHEQLAALMNMLGLPHGAIDLIVTPAGEHVFLEVNPTGEWGMLQRDLDLPIAAAIADALLDEQEMPA